MALVQKSAPPSWPGSAMKIVTLKDLKGEDANNQNDSDEEKARYFAGGGKNTREAAKEEEDKEPSASKPAPFQGSSRTLKGKETKGSSKPETTKKDKEDEAVERTLVLYDNGFVIAGPGMEDSFKDYAEPQNAALLDQITEGRVPLREMNLKPYQRVTLKIDYKHGQQYQKPTGPIPKFVGSGKRLDSAKENNAQPSSSTTAPAQDQQPEFPYDASRPTAMLQIRCRSGKRLSIRVNLDTKFSEVIHYVSTCTGLKASEFTLVSMSNVNLSEAPNRDKSVAELDVQNSVLIQK